MTKPDWLIDELIYAGDEHLDPEYVAGYNQKSAVDHADDIATFQAHGLNSESVVIDMGAGTGLFALALAPHCRRVVAVDVSDAMLAVLEREIEGKAIDNIDVVHAGLLSYEHLGDPADFVYSRNTLHHLPDFWKATALHRVADMLRPGGVLLLHDLIYSFDPAETNEVIESWLSNAAPTPDIGFTREDLELHIRTEYSTFSWLLESMLVRAGFEIREAIHRPSRTYSAYVCAKP